MTVNPSAYQGGSTACLTPPRKWTEDVQAWVSTSWDHFDPSHAHRLFWPDRPYRPDIEILVAGCGPSQAAVIAYNNPQARVTAIDVDEAALNHETYLRHKHLLLNLDVRPLHPLPVEEVAILNRKFDLVIASGVLQHLDSPGPGMKALADVLKFDGVAAVMVPSRHMTTPEDMDAGGASYTVQDCLDIVAGAGLVFQEWVLKTPYYPPAPTATDDEFLDTVRALPERRIWSAIEPLRNHSGRHLFTACRPERPAATYRIDFSAPEVVNYVPQGRPNVSLGETHISRPGFAAHLTPSELAIAREVDGERSIGRIAGQAEAEIGATVEFVKKLWQTDFVAIHLPA